MILVNKIHYYVLLFFAIAGIVDLLFFIHVFRKVKYLKKIKGGDSE